MIQEEQPQLKRNLINRIPFLIHSNLVTMNSFLRRNASLEITFCVIDIIVMVALLKMGMPSYTPFLSILLLWMITSALIYRFNHRYFLILMYTIHATLFFYGVKTLSFLLDNKLVACSSILTIRYNSCLGARRVPPAAIKASSIKPSLKDTDSFCIRFCNV